MDKILPAENKSQEVGHHTIQSFRGNHPISWRVSELDGDADAGFDGFVQVVADGKYSFAFFIQIKGSAQERSDGQNIHLNNSNEFFSHSLESKNLNYYIETGFPVMLIFCDLAAHEDPRDANCYYHWISDELNDIDLTQKQSHSFRIPVENNLREADVSAYLKRYCKSKQLTNKLAQKLNNLENENKAFSILDNRLDDDTFIKTIISEQDSPWLSPSKGTHTDILHKSHTLLQRKDYISAIKELDKISTELTSMNDHEKAEYFLQKGLLADINWDFTQAFLHFKRSHSILTDNKKYHIPFIEFNIRQSTDNSNELQKILEKITNKNEPEYIAIKIKLYALLGELEPALNLAQDKDEREIKIAKGIAYVITSHYTECIEQSHTILNEIDDKHSSDRLVPLILKAKSEFYLATQKTVSRNIAPIIPPQGLREFDTTMMRKSWDTLLSAWELASKHHYPSNMEIVVDITCILGSYFEEGTVVLKHLKKFSEQRPKNQDIANYLSMLAINSNDDKIALEAINRLPSAADKHVQKSLIYFNMGEKRKALDEVIENFDHIIHDKPQNYGISLALAAVAADSLADMSNQEKLTIFLQTHTDLEKYYNFYQGAIEVEEEVLSKNESIVNLYNKQNNNKDREVYSQIISNITVENEECANIVIDIVEHIFSYRDISSEEAIKFCSALHLKKHWPQTVETATKYLTKFKNNIYLLLYLASSLDNIGQTAKAIEILNTHIEQINYSQQYYSLFTNIALRCGLTELAQKLINRVLEKETNKKHKVKLLHLLLSLNIQNDPQSPQLMPLIEKIGKLSNHNDEKEEGSFLVAYLTTTASGQNKPDEDLVKEVKIRSEHFFKKFPNSSILKIGNIPKDKSPNELLAEIEKLTGLTPERKQRYAKNENLLRANKFPIPYNLKPQALLHVCNLPHLWEITKNTWVNDSRFSLIMAEEIDYSKTEDFFAKIPILDDVTLFVLCEIGLLNELITYHPQIAISKSLILRFQNWNNFFHRNTPNTPVNNVLNFIRDNLTQIIQIGDTFIHGESKENIEEEQIERELKNEQYVLFSDDLIYRILTLGSDNKEKSFCTQEWLLLLHTTNRISYKKYVDSICKLTSFNISGIDIQFKDILFSLNNTQYQQTKFISIFNYAFNTYKPSKEHIFNLSNFLLYMLKDNDDTKISNESITTIWKHWYYKVSISSKEEIDYYDFFIFPYLRTCLTIVRNNLELSLIAKLTACFKYFIFSIAEEQNNENIIYGIIDATAKKLAQQDFEECHTLYDQIREGLGEFSEESYLFKQTFEKELLSGDFKLSPAGIYFR